MTVDIASLVMAVDSRQVSAGAAALDKLTESGRKAEASTQALAAANKILAAATEYAAKGFALYKIADLIRESTMLAARFETMGVVMKVAGNNAGYTRAEMEAYSKTLQKSGISMLESRNVLTQLATANIDLANAAKLGRAAQDLAVVGNINSSEALQRMVHGIKSGQIEILRTLGLNTSFENSYKTMAVQLGTTTEKLTENQKMTARTNAVLTEATKYTGIYEESMTTAGKAMTSLTRYWEDLKVKAGEAFLPALTTQVFNTTESLKQMNKELEDAGQNGLIADVGEALNGALKVGLQTVAVLAANVAFVFKMVGQEIGAIAAQAARIAVLDFKGAAEIGDAVTADAERARAALDRYESKVLGVAATTTAVAKVSEEERIATGNAARAAAEAEDKRLAAAKAAAEATKKLSSEQKSFIEGLEKEAAAIGRSTEEKKLHAAVVLKLTGARLEHVKALMLEMSQYQLAEDKAKQRAEARQKESDGIEDFMKAEKLRLVEVGNAADKTVRDARAEYKQFGLSKSAVLELTLAKMEGRQKMLQPDSDAYESLQREIAAQRELIEIAKSTEVRDAAIKTAQDAQAAWKQATNQVEQSLTDALMNAFMAGKGFGKTFVDSIKSMFNSMVLRPVISAIVSPVAGAMTSAMGFSSAANAATGGNLLSSGADLLGMGSALAGAGSFMGQLGTGLLASTQTALGMTATAAQASYAASMGVAAQTGSLMGSLGPLISAAPYLLAIAGVYTLAKKLDHSGTPHTGGGSAYSASSGLISTSVGGWTGGSSFGDGFGSVVGSQSTVDMTAGLAKSIVGILDSTATAFGQKAGYMAATSFADDSSKDPAWGSLVIKQMDNVLVDWQATRTSKWAPRTFSDGEAGSAEYLKAISSDVRSALNQIDLPKWATDMLTAIGDTPDLAALATGVAQITAAKNALDLLGRQLVGFAAMSDAAVSSLVQASGGVAALFTSAATYYANFYSDAERGANTLGEIGKELAAFGMKLPGTRDEFRALVEAQQSAGNGEAVAALLRVSGAFASVVPAAEAAAVATNDATEAMARAATSVLDEVKRLRGAAAVGSGAGAAYYGAQFAILTSQARAGSASAMAQLPAISSALESAQLANAVSAVDEVRIRSRIANSLSDTIGLTDGASLGDPQATPLSVTVQTLKDNNKRLEDLVQELSDKLSKMQAETQATAVNSDKLISIMTRVTPGGNAVATQAV